MQCCCSPSGLPIRTRSSINTPGPLMWVTPLPLFLRSIHPLQYLLPLAFHPSVRPSPPRPAHPSDSWWMEAGGVEPGDNGEQAGVGVSQCHLNFSKL